MEESRSKVTWDRGIPFHTCERRILRLLKTEDRPTNRAYAAILLIQLRNGSRVSEAVRAAKKFLETGKRELKVRLSKKKRREERLMVIPERIERSHLCAIEKVPEDKLVKRVKVYAVRRLGINTHSLRYAFVTHLLEQGISPAIIAKITGHSKLDFILTYTQKKAAEDLLRTLL